MKVYMAVVSTYYTCGDESYNHDSTIGIFSDPEQAFNEAMKCLYYDFNYDAEEDLYFGDFADEAWASVYEYELDSTDSEENGGIMKKDESGIWYNATKKMEEEIKEADS